MTTDIFFKIDSLEGDSVGKNHENEIDVLAWSWGASQTGTTHIATGAGAGKANVQDLSFTKRVDAASAGLLQACLTGKHIAKAVLVAQKAGGTSPLPYLTITLTDLIVSSVSHGGSGGEDHQTENVTLNFAKIDFQYQPQDKTGAKKGGPKTAVFDVAKNTA